MSETTCPRCGFDISNMCDGRGAEILGDLMQRAGNCPMCFMQPEEEQVERSSSEMVEDVGGLFDDGSSDKQPLYCPFCDFEYQVNNPTAMLDLIRKMGSCPECEGSEEHQRRLAAKGGKELKYEPEQTIVIQMTDGQGCFEDSDEITPDEEERLEDLFG